MGGSARRARALDPHRIFMKMGITAKLFVAVLATNLLTAIAVGVAVRSSFNSGFRNYVQEREARRIDNLDRALVRAYAQNGSWEFLRNNDRLWAALNRPDREFADFHAPPASGARPFVADRGAPPESRDPGAKPPPPFDRHPPPPRDDGSAFREREPRPPEGSSGPGGPPPGVLLDRQHHVVAGRVDATAPSAERPVVVDGETVGWLATSAAPASLDTLDIRFRDEQLRAVWLISAFAMLIATGVALLLARRFLAPIRRLGTATHRLASGDYSTRVAPASGDELGALLDDFNRLAQTLDRNEQLRRNFMADISHELRTPLAVLRGELEALQDGIRTPTAESVASLQAEVATLAKLVDDLYELALADVGALAYRFERVNISALLEVALAAFAQRLTGRRLDLESDLAPTPVMLDADAQRLTQLFNNLLENCVRHTDPGGRVSVALHRDAEQVHIDIQDSAPGVPDSALARIFERLYRVEASRNRDYGGAGLGLAICRNIVEAHRGEISAAPSPLGGLWIRVRLPLARTQ